MVREANAVGVHRRRPGIRENKANCGQNQSPCLQKTSRRRSDWVIGPHEEREKVGGLRNERESPTLMGNASGLEKRESAVIGVGRRRRAERLQPCLTFGSFPE